MAVRVLSVCVLMLGAWTARGAEAPQGSVRVSGRVAATRDQARVVRAATLTTPKGEVYQLVMDEHGKSLAGVMAGESAEILGVPSQKGDAKWLQVLDYADERVTAGHEYWRRMRCIACVVLPATRNAAVPANLRGATPLAGRFFDLKREFTAWASDERSLWVAADNEVLQIDFGTCKVVRSLGRKDGLPDQLIYQLLSDGKTLWIVHRGGVAAASIADGRVADLPRLKAAYARVFAQSGTGFQPVGIWVVADTGTFRLKAPGEGSHLHFALGGEVPNEDVTPFPALPTAEQIRRFVENGIWQAHWRRRTAHLIASPASIGERLYVGSYGDLYELAGGKWERIAEAAGDQAARNGRLWFLDAKGLAEYDPEAKKTTGWAPPDSVRGRYTRLLVTDSAAWLVAEPEGSGKAGPPVGGGLARFDLAAHSWQAWPQINGIATNSVACLATDAQDVWAATMDGRYRSRSAHPGMTTTTRLDFDAGGFALNRFRGKGGEWDSYPLKLTALEKRLICGQEGQRSMDVIEPQFIEALSVGARRMFAVTRLMPKQFFGGYWPCIEQVASRPDAEAPWAAAFAHHPEQTDLQGEQPLVLNISSGELTRIGSSLKDQLWEAVGQDLVLALFHRDGRHWAVTGSVVAVFDEAAGEWKRVAEPDFRWYWRATAALDDGRSLTLGSDRGLVCRLDLDTGRFEHLVALKDRAIARIARDKEGATWVLGRQAPLGRLPVQLAATLKPLDCDAARGDGKGWAAAKPDDLPPAGPAAPWAFKQFERKDHLDKSDGNFLCGPPNGAPRYYVKETFFPQFLCSSPDGSRIWLSTYTGLLRLDVGR